MIIITTSKQAYNMKVSDVAVGSATSNPFLLGTQSLPSLSSLC